MTKKNPNEISAKPAPEPEPPNSLYGCTAPDCLGWVAGTDLTGAECVLHGSASMVEIDADELARRQPFGPEGRGHAEGAHDGEVTTLAESIAPDADAEPEA